MDDLSDLESDFTYELEWPSSESLQITNAELAPLPIGFANVQRVRFPSKPKEGLLSLDDQAARVCET